MANQVKFYSVATLPESPDANGIYFVGGKELYKGSSRVGFQGAVTAVETPSGMVKGDINIYDGVAKVYDGTSWVALGASVSIGSLDAALVGASSGTTKIVTGIKEDDGIVTAYVEDFPTITSPSDGYVSLNGTSAAIAGWASLTAVVDYSASGGAIVTATSGSFTNLTVTGAATFSATTVSATTLSVATETAATFGGSTVSQIADREADARISAIAEATKSATSNGVTVSVTTQSGGVTGVALTVPQATTITASTGTSYATEGAVKTYVDGKFENITNVMDFVGVVTELPATAQKGDVVVIGANPTGTGLVEAQEYIYTGTSWELIGDQNTYATKAALEATNSTVASVSTRVTALESWKTGLATASTLSATSNDTTVSVTTQDGKVTGVQVTAASIAGGSSSATQAGMEVKVVTAATTAAPTVTMTFTEGAITSTNTSLVTGSTVWAYINASVTSLGSDKASIGTGNAAGANGVSGTVVLASNAAPTLSIYVTPGSIVSGDTSVVTGGAVYTAISSAIDALDSTVSSTVGTSMLTGTVVESDGKLTSMSLTLNSVTAIASTNTNDQIPTAKAVYDAIDALDSSITSDDQAGLSVTVVESNGKITDVQATLCWLDADGSVIS